MSHLQTPSLKEQYHKPPSPPTIFIHLTQLPLTTSLQIFQLLLSLIILGLYIPDLSNASSKPDASSPSAPWIIAIITSVISALTSLIQITPTVLYPLIKHLLATTIDKNNNASLLPTSSNQPPNSIKRLRKRDQVCNIIWSAILTVIWAAVSGTFGVAFIGSSNKEGQEDMRSFTTDEVRMKVGVAFDLIMMVLWGVGFVMACVACCCGGARGKKTRSLAREEEVSVAPVDVGKEERDLEGGGESVGRDLHAGRGLQEERVGKEFVMNIMVERSLVGGSNGAAGPGENEQWKSFVMGGQDQKGTERDSPPPAYGQLTV